MEEQILMQKGKNGLLNWMLLLGLETEVIDWYVCSVWGGKKRWLVCMVVGIGKVLGKSKCESDWNHGDFRRTFWERLLFYKNRRFSIFTQNSRKNQFSYAILEA